MAAGDSEIGSPAAALDALLRSGDLDELRSATGRFNLFEALGMIRQEVKHSHLLTHLLDPQQAHGLGDRFLRSFLIHLVSSAAKGAVTLDQADLQEMDLTRAVVFRELEFMDILVEVPAARLYVLVENKIDTGEHSDQLARYLEKVRARYPDWSEMLVLLSPAGTRPSVADFIPADYGLVCRVIDDLLGTTHSIDGDVRVLLDHYRQMLRRHIMSDSDIAQQCREIYRRHKSALDLIFEHRPDMQNSLREALLSMVQEEPSLRLLQSGKRFITFVPQEWERSAVLTSGHGWDFGGNRVLAFQFENTESALTLHLWVGPVVPVHEPVRDRLIDLARKHQPPFRVTAKRLSPKFWSVYQMPFLAAQDYEGLDGSGLEDQVRERLREFLHQDLPKLSQVLAAEDWVWQG